MPEYVGHERHTVIPAYLRHPSHMGTRLAWPIGYARQARWAVRQYVDIVSRERVAMETASEMSLARQGSGKVRDAAMARAIAAGIVVGHAPTRDGAWDEWTPRGITNAREARAAERGRGIVKRGPSAARVTTRDHYAPAKLLRHLPTVGVATHPDATGSDYAYLLDTILQNPTLATYRAYHAPRGVVVADTAFDVGYSTLTLQGHAPMVESSLYPRVNRA